MGTFVSLPVALEHAHRGTLTGDASFEAAAGFIWKNWAKQPTAKNMRKGKDDGARTQTKTQSKKEPGA